MTLEEKRKRVSELMLKDLTHWGLALEDVKELQRLSQEIEEELNNG